MKSKQINDYPNYIIYDDGRVYSKNTKRFMKLHTVRHGYVYVDVYKNSKRKRFYVHRLVAEHFLTIDDKKVYIDHLDGDKTNNKCTNLEFVTRSENELRKHRTKKKRRGVSWNTNNKKWSVFIRMDRKNKFLGGFTDKEKAYETFYNKYLEIYGIEPW